MCVDHQAEFSALNTYIAPIRAPGRDMLVAVVVVVVVCSTRGYLSIAKSDLRFETVVTTRQARGRLREARYTRRNKLVVTDMTVGDQKNKMRAAR